MPAWFAPYLTTMPRLSRSIRHKKTNGYSSLGLVLQKQTSPKISLDIVLGFWEADFARELLRQKAQGCSKQTVFWKAHISTWHYFAASLSCNCRQWARPLKAPLLATKSFFWKVKKSCWQAPCKGVGFSHRAVAGRSKRRKAQGLTERKLKIE